MWANPRIEVEGVKEFQRAVRKSVDRDLGKRLAQANKSIGQRIVENLSPAPDPAAVGKGKAGTVRPSASRRDVVLRTGGAHRARKPLPPRPTLSKSPYAFRTWGKQFRVGQAPRNGRPDILKSAMKQREWIENAYLQGVADALRPAFDKTKP